MGAVPLKWLVLLVITVQTTALVLVMRYSRANSSGPAYFASTAVLLTEAAKFTVVLITLWLENGRSVPRTAAMLRREIFSQPRDTAQLAVPSFLYTIQNNLVFVALTNLDAPTFQVLYQLKILVTALMSSMMLKRRVRPVQWAALLILVIGVCLVQLDKTSSASDARQRHNNQLVGLLAVLALCMSSGYAGVFFERVLKNGGAGGVTGGASKPLSIRNMQLSLFSLPFGAAAAAINDGTAIAEHGFFYGYTRYTWAVIILQALGGLAVSATVKYADNILKGFATSISILLSVLISWAYLGDVSLSGTFGAGALLVVGATFLYSYSPPAPASSPQHRPAAAAAAAGRAKV